MPLPVITTVPQRIQDQWLFTDAELDATPAILQGMPIAEERARRAKGVNFITQAGIMLKLPQVTLGTASMFLHRIFMRISMDDAKGGIHHYVSSCCAPSLGSEPFGARFDFLKVGLTITPEHSSHRPLPRHQIRRKLPQNQRHRHRCRQSRR